MTKGSILIDLAFVEDAMGIVEVQKEVWIATYPNSELGITAEDITSQTDNFDTERLIKRLQSEDANRLYLVAREGGKVIGMALGLKGDEQNTLQAMYVYPSYQGQGVGSALMNGILEWSAGKEIVLGVVSYNENAIGFYRKFGFVPNGERHDEVTTLPSGKVLPEIEMIHRVD